MDFESYFLLVTERYPEKNFDKIKCYRSNKLDLINKIAQLLFMDGEIESPLAHETRRLLKGVSKNGLLMFK